MADRQQVSDVEKKLQPAVIIGGQRHPAHRTRPTKDVKSKEEQEMGAEVEQQAEGGDVPENKERGIISEVSTETLAARIVEQECIEEAVTAKKYLQDESKATPSTYNPPPKTAFASDKQAKQHVHRQQRQINQPKQGY